MAFSGCCTGKEVPWFSWSSHNLYMESVHRVPCHIGWGMNTRLPHLDSTAKRRKSTVSYRTFTVPVSLKPSSSFQPEDYFGDEGNNNASEDSSKELLDKPLASDQEFVPPFKRVEELDCLPGLPYVNRKIIPNGLRLLLADSEREKLVKKLGEANQQNRFLKRQMMVNEETLISFKTELAVMELETEALVALAEEIAQASIPKGSRKINGKYIQSHLVSRLRVLREKFAEQMKDVVAAQSKEVSLFWVGMAENVQVMGSFDGWSQGEHLSPDYNGSFTKFTTKLILRPGRYEIKFLVDGEWKLSPEYPTVGGGLTQNNLLVVE